MESRKYVPRSHVCGEQLQVRLGPWPNKQMLAKGACESQQCRGKAENTLLKEEPKPLRFLIWSLFGQRVLFNGEGGNRARTRQPMADRLEIIHGIAGRAAASESGGEVRLDEVYARSPRLLNIRRACPGTALLSQEVGLPLFDRR